MADHNTGIYEIKNTVNGKRYVGSAVDFRARWTKHQSLLRRGVHHSPQMQHAWNKHGSDAFLFGKLLVCTRENLVCYEQIALDALKPEYNVCKTAFSCLGVKRGEAHRAALSARQKGKPVSQETRDKISASLKGRPGNPMSDATRRLVSSRKKGILTPHLAALRDARIGIPRSADVRVKLSQGSAKLSEEDVRCIRARALSGERQIDIAGAFHIRQSSVSEIVRRVTYVWVV